MSQSLHSQTALALVTPRFWLEVKTLNLYRVPSPWPR